MHHGGVSSSGSLLGPALGPILGPAPTLAWSLPLALTAALIVIGLGGCASAPPDPGLGYLREGEAALAEGSNERAVAAYQLALSSAPGDPRAMRGLLAAQVANGDGEAALETLSWIEEVGTEPVDPCPALTLVTRDRLGRGDFEGAESTARQGLESGCGGASERVAGVLVERAGATRATDPTAALLLYREAIALDPSRPGAFLQAGELLIEEGDSAASVALLAGGLTHHPDDRELRDLMVRALSIR
jgi:tetratricopeptide (TPR) repeat protein